LGESSSKFHEETSGQPLDVASDGHSLALVEIAGRVKWFDVSKGYGFIIPDNGEPDVLLHVTVLRRDGFQTIHEGARVVAEATRRDRGMQVFRVLSVEAGEAVHPSELQPARTHVQVTPVGGFEIVIVKWFNRIRGFGFLSRGEYSCIWRPCGATALPTSSRATVCWRGSAPDPRG
jgi:CspA family cold shock protein